MAKRHNSPSIFQARPIGARYMSYGGTVDEVIGHKTYDDWRHETVVVRDVVSGEIREHSTCPTRDDRIRGMVAL